MRNTHLRALQAPCASAAMQITTLPIDTAKVRLQLMQHAKTGVARPGMLKVMSTVAAEEGITALYKGFWPAIHRQIVFASLRIGLYGQVCVCAVQPARRARPTPTRALHVQPVSSCCRFLRTFGNRVKPRFP
ncbi:solute carrier family 25 protein [archaeon]|nr:MAG: solute carrier family 25 protein [archaeon]